MTSTKVKMDKTAIPKKERRWTISLSDEEIREAERRGAEADRNEPRALAACYDAQTDRLVLELRSGITVSIPRRLLQGLHDADPEAVAEVEILPSGEGLHWEKLNQDFSVPGLVAGIFGSPRWMGRLGGQVRSPAKTAAARENGRKGGRPRRRATPAPIPSGSDSSP